MQSAILRKLLPLSRRGIVFAGHGVAREFKNQQIESIHIAYSDFAETVETLREFQFDFLSLPQVLELLRKGVRHHKHWAHLSFDDGYQNNFDVVYPFLKERGIPFSIFVSTHYVETQDYFPTFYLRYAQSLQKEVSAELQKRVMYAPIAEFDKVMSEVKSWFSPEELRGAREFVNDRPLSLEALKNLAADPLVHIGSHAHRHVILSPEQDPSAIRRELETSIKRLCGDWSVSEKPAFCYPNGDHNAQAEKICEQVGFSGLLLSDSGFVGPRTSASRIPRFWLANKRRTQAICAMAAVGDKALYFFGRKPPRGRDLT